MVSNSSSCGGCGVSTEDAEQQQQQQHVDSSCPPQEGPSMLMPAELQQQLVQSQQQQQQQQQHHNHQHSVAPGGDVVGEAVRGLVAARLAQAAAEEALRLALDKVRVALGALAADVWL
jgi:preprotein translocase subunit YajC